jgi:hypothetical protein
MSAARHIPDSASQFSDQVLKLNYRRQYMRHSRLWLHHSGCGFFDEAVIRGNLMLLDSDNIISVEMKGVRRWDIWQMQFRVIFKVFSFLWHRQLVRFNVERSERSSLNAMMLKGKLRSLSRPEYDPARFKIPSLHETGIPKRDEWLQTTRHAVCTLRFAEIV